MCVDKDYPVTVTPFPSTDRHRHRPDMTLIDRWDRPPVATEPCGDSGTAPPSTFDVLNGRWRRNSSDSSSVAVGTPRNAHNALIWRGAVAVPSPPSSAPAPDRK